MTVEQVYKDSEESSFSETVFTIHSLMLIKKFARCGLYRSK